MKYEIRSLKGYIAKIFQTNTNKKWKGLGEKGKSQRYCAKYCKFKVLKDLACNMYGEKDPCQGTIFTHAKR